MEMTLTENPLLKLYEEVINNNNLDAMDELYGSGYINHAAPFGLAKDMEGLRILFKMFIDAFPDQYIVADDIMSYTYRHIHGSTGYRKKSYYDRNRH